MAFGGTISLDFDAFRAQVRSICGSVVRHGFSRVMLLNGHGGNVSALSVIAQELALQFDAPISTATYWLLRDAAAAFERILSVQKNVRHACEAETSMLLALAPELVDTDAMHSVEPTEASVISERGAYRYRSFTELSPSGVIGFPAQANAEKGELLLEAAAEALAEVLLDGQTW